MKSSLSRTVSLIAVLTFILAAFAAVAYAEDAVVLPHFSDGRINAYDIDAPAAIFAVYDYPYADDVDLGVLNRLEFWGYVNSEQIDKVLEVSAADILAADSSAGSAVVASANGYTLYREADGSLTLVAAHLDGTPYQFNWEQSL